MIESVMKSLILNLNNCQRNNCTQKVLGTVAGVLNNINNPGYLKQALENSKGKQFISSRSYIILEMTRGMMHLENQNEIIMDQFDEFGCNGKHLSH